MIGFGGEAGHRRRARVLEAHDGVAERRPDPPRLALEQGRPCRVVLDQGHGRVVGLPLADRHGLEILVGHGRRTTSTLHANLHWLVAAYPCASLTRASSGEVA